MVQKVDPKSLTSRVNVPNVLLKAPTPSVGAPRTGGFTRMDRLLTVADVAALLGKSEQWVAAQARDGRIPARKVGREWRWTEADVAAYIDSLAAAAAAPTSVRRRRRNTAA